MEYFQEEPPEIPCILIEITFTTPEGERIETNLKVKDSDLELLKQLSE